MPTVKPQSSEPGASVYVIGHKNPDTDAICAAIGYAEFLRATGLPGAVASCCGGINPRTQWVLDTAGVEAPRLLMDVRPTADRICRRRVVLAHEDETFLEVYQRMHAADVRALPVLDRSGRVVGVPRVDDLLALLMHSIEGPDYSPDEARRVRTSLGNAARSLGAEIHVARDLEAQQDFILTVAAASYRTLDERLGKFSADQLLVIVGDRPEVHALAIERRVRGMILTGGAEPDKELVASAERAGVSLLCYAHDTASAVQLIRCSRRVGEATGGPFLTVGSKTLVSSLPALVADSHQQLFPVMDEESGGLLGVFSKSDLLDPPRPKLVLVDHNEFSQAVTGAEEAEIVEVLDHHRLGGNLVSREPIRFINEPVGSTSTIVANAFRQRGLVPSQGTAICLCAGLISDTLHLTSPTTTETDHGILPWLAGIAGIEAGDFAREFFRAGSVLRTWPAEDMVAADRKEYNEHGWKVSISQIEEVALDEFPRRQAELQAALAAVLSERGLDFAALLVTDITRHLSLLLVAGEEAVARRIDYPKDSHGVFHLEGVVSRKKQFFPYLSRALAKASPNP